MLHFLEEQEKIHTFFFHCKYKELRNTFSFYIYLLIFLFGWLFVEDYFKYTISINRFSCFNICFSGNSTIRYTLWCISSRYFNWIMVSVYFNVLLIYTRYFYYNLSDVTTSAKGSLSALSWALVLGALSPRPPDDPILPNSPILVCHQVQWLLNNH